MECFTDYLEKLSVTKVEDSGMAVIVIDGADFIKVIQLSLILVSSLFPLSVF